MTAHARLMPPSSAHRRIACPGSYVLEGELPDSSSEAADDGTAMHWVAATCLQSDDGRDAAAFIGRLVPVHDEGEEPRLVEIDDDKAALAQVYVDNIRRLAAADGAELYVEECVDFSAYVDVPEQFGTCDARIVLPGFKTLQVHDLKTGYHRVRAERNPQLMLYALGALELTQLVHDIDVVQMFIHQPRHYNEPDTWSCNVEELLAFAEEAKEATRLCLEAADYSKRGRSWEEKYLRPADEPCKFCKAKATCPALRGVASRVVTFQPSVGSAAIDDFDVVEVASAAQAVTTATEQLGQADGKTLGKLMAMTDLVECWVKGVRAEVERRLLAAQEVPGFKLVQGRKGRREWVDAEAAEAALKAMRLKQEEMYQFKVISPTQAEKLTKGDKPAIGPRQWPKLQTLVRQSEGKPSVTTADDKRPALELKPPVDDFDVIDPGKEEGVEALL